MKRGGGVYTRLYYKTGFVRWFTHMELQFGLSQGYVVTEVLQIIHWPPERRSRTLFKGTVDTCMHMFIKITVQISRLHAKMVT